MAAPDKPNDLQSLLRINAELIKTVEEQQNTIQQLREELNLYRRKLFGQSSERHVEDGSQLHLFDVGDQQAAQYEAAEDDQIEKPLKRRRRKKKAEKLPAHLKRKVIEADVAAKDRICPCCSEEMPIVGTDISERLDLIPA